MLRLLFDARCFAVVALRHSTHCPLRVLRIGAWPCLHALSAMYVTSLRYSATLRASSCCERTTLLLAALASIAASVSLSAASCSRVAMVCNVASLLAATATARVASCSSTAYCAGLRVNRISCIRSIHTLCYQRHKTHIYDKRKEVIEGPLSEALYDVTYYIQYQHSRESIG